MKTLPIVGARFRPPAEDVLRLMPAGTPLVLRRQPENPHDGNAVQVVLEQYDEWLETLEITEDDMPIHLGFIPREDAAVVAPVMDNWFVSMADATVERDLNDWPATLSFSPTGRPSVAFDIPGENQ